MLYPSCILIDNNLRDRKYLVKRAAAQKMLEDNVITFSLRPSLEKYRLVTTGANRQIAIIAMGAVAYEMWCTGARYRLGKLGLLPVDYSDQIIVENVIATASDIVYDFNLNIANVLLAIFWATGKRQTQSALIQHSNDINNAFVSQLAATVDIYRTAVEEITLADPNYFNGQRGRIKRDVALFTALVPE
jgi:hypothetical protein